MDADEEYVEYDDNVDDESPLSRKPEAKQFPQVKRYKDDTYRCLLCATSFLTYCCGMQCQTFAMLWLYQQQLLAFCTSY